MTEIITQLRVTFAMNEALLQRDQTTLDLYRNTYSEDEAWHMQAAIDTKRFDLELDRLALNALS